MGMTQTQNTRTIPNYPAPVVWEGMDVLPIEPPDEDWAWYMEAMYNSEI